MKLDFSNFHVLIIGDIMLDKYIYGTNTRVSPEANVPVILKEKQETKLGGAANVVLNIDSLEAKASLLGVIGDDMDGEKVVELLESNHISSALIIKDSSRKTTSKTRILSNDQHIARIDSEDTFDLSQDINTQLLSKLETFLGKEKVDIVILQDYNKGVLNGSNIPQIIQLLNEKSIPFTVDPKEDNFFAYQGAKIFKPNLKELKKAIPDLQSDLANLNSILLELQQRNKAEINLVTLGEKGMVAQKGSRSYTVEAHQADHIDVCGAGDAVISMATLCWLNSCETQEIINYANMAGFVTCLSAGVCSITWEKLILRFSSL